MEMDKRQRVEAAASARFYSRLFAVWNRMDRNGRTARRARHELPVRRTRFVPGISEYFCRTWAFIL